MSEEKNHTPKQQPPTNVLARLAHDRAVLTVTLRNGGVATGTMVQYHNGFVRLEPAMIQGTARDAALPVPWVLLDRTDVKMIHPAEEVKGERG